MGVNRRQECVREGAPCALEHCGAPMALAMAGRHFHTVSLSFGAPSKLLWAATPTSSTREAR